MLKKAKVLILSLLVAVFSLSTINAQTPTEKVDAFELIDMIVNAEVDYGLSGAQLVVLHKGEMVKQSAYGYTNSYSNIEENGKVVLDQVNVIPRDQRNKLKNDTLFDLASNTKMYAGNYAIQKLITEEKLTLDTKVVDIFEDFTYRGIGVDQQSEMTIGHLLRHDSGFIASPKYHNNLFTGNLGNKDNPENWLYSQNADEILEKLLLTPLEYELDTKVRYSDVDFMLLGKIVEELTGKPLDVYLAEEVYSPLGLKNLTFNPLENGFTKNHTSSSELHGNTRDGRETFNNIRHTVVTGEVHDEKAFHSFAGVSGHAGLFGSATDTAALAQIMLTGGNGIFSQETIDDVIQPSPLNDTYAYGWRRQGETKGYDWVFSKYASEGTVGHTGWTGTITQIDFDNELVIALFTNARNSPIMGPGKNDFWTKGFNTNDYGTITTLVYVALGLGDNFDATQFVINKIESTEYDSPSHKNSVRALYTVLKQLALTDEVARDYVLNHIEEAQLNIDFEEHTIHLDITHLTNVDKGPLNELIEKLEMNESDNETLEYAKVITNDKTATQEIVDAVYAELKAFDTEVSIEDVDLSKLAVILDQIEKLDDTLYTPESYKALIDRFEELEVYLNEGNLEQDIIDEFYNDLMALYDALQTKEVVVDVDIDDKNDDKKTEVPHTGIHQSTILPLSMLLAGGTLLAVTSYKRKQS